MLNSKAQRRSVNWQKRTSKFQNSLSISTYSPNIKGASRIRFHISEAVCLIFNLVGDITLNYCGLFCLSISQYSKFLIPLFIMARVNCQVPINSEIIFVKILLLPQRGHGPNQEEIHLLHGSKLSCLNRNLL